VDQLITEKQTPPPPPPPEHKRTIEVVHQRTIEVVKQPDIAAHVKLAVDMQRGRV